MQVTRNRIGYALQAAGATFAPADATTYYFGSLASVVPTTTSAIERLYIPRSGVIKAAYVFFNQSAGTSETSTISVRVNDTTDTTISAAVTNDASATNSQNAALNIAVAAGNYVEIKWVCPTWVTNPTNVRPTVILYIE